MFSMLKAGILSFVIVTLVTPFIIFLFKKFNITQPIREELPQDHQRKSGTPLMVGIVFCVGIVVAIALHTNSFMLLLATIFILFGSVGLLDDSWKAIKKDPGGVSGRTKLILQFFFTFFILFILLNYFNFDSTISITREISLSLPLFIYLPIITLFIVGSANAINFTDGMDGLLTIVSIPTFTFFFLTSEHIEIKVISIALIGCLLGFLIFNIYPAKAFMGDTGSLAIGGILSFFSVIEHVEILVPLLFIVFFAEQFSVIIQVYFYKTTGKRIFRMSPIHYHYGIKYGWSENKIVVLFGVVSWLGSVLSTLYWYWFMT